jgi:glycosyltransferase involved in cell wall biosynthesis
MKYIYKKSDLILVQSKGFIRYVKEQGAEDYKIKYFPNWAEELYVPMAPISNTKEQMLLPKNSFVAMFAGNIGAAQSLGTIVDAAIILKDYPISWVILGDGRKKQWLEEQISKEGLVDVIHTLGFKPMRTMPLFFSYADVLLVTLEAHEIMSAWIPGKLQSYLASGKPIIGALKGEGSKVINESKAGFSVEPGDSVNLARNVLELSRMDKKTREKMGNNALDYYNRNFNRETLINKLEKYFDEIK